MFIETSDTPTVAFNLHIFFSQIKLNYSIIDTVLKKSFFSHTINGISKMIVKHVWLLIRHLHNENVKYTQAKLNNCSIKIWCILKPYTRNLYPNNRMAIEKVVKRIDLPYKEITGFSGLKRVLIRRHYWFPREGTLARAVHLNPLDISGEGRVQSWPLLTTGETRWGRYFTILFFAIILYSLH